MRTPAELWAQAKGDPEEYRRLMREEGHVVRFACPRCKVERRHRHGPDGTLIPTDIFGHDVRG